MNPYERAEHHLNELESALRSFPFESVLEGVEQAQIVHGLLYGVRIWLNAKSALTRMSHMGKDKR